MSRGDRVDREHWWTTLRNNVVKCWRIIYVPMRYFFIGDGADELNEQQRQEEENALAAEAAEPVEEAAESTPEATVDEAAGLEDTVEEAGPEEEEVDMSGMSDDDAALAAEIIARLQAEAAADEAAKAAEIDAARQFAENKNDAAFNETTGSFSGNYGTGPVDDDTMDAVSAILQQNDRSGIDDLLGG